MASSKRLTRDRLVFTIADVPPAEINSGDSTLSLPVSPPAVNAAAPLATAVVEERRLLLAKRPSAGQLLNSALPIVQSRQRHHSATALVATTSRDNMSDQQSRAHPHRPSTAASEEDHIDQQGSSSTVESPGARLTPLSTSAPSTLTTRTNMSATSFLKNLRRNLLLNGHLSRSAGGGCRPPARSPG